MHRIPGTPTLYDWLTGNHGLIVVPVSLITRPDGSADLEGGSLARTVRDHYLARGRQLEAELGRFIAQARAAGEALTGRVWLSLISPVVYLPVCSRWNDRVILPIIQRGLRALQDRCGSSVMTIAVPPLGDSAVAALMHRELTSPCFSLMDGRAPVAEVTAAPAVPAPAPTSFKRRNPFGPDLLALVKGRKLVGLTGHRPNKLGGYSDTITEYSRSFFRDRLRMARPDLVMSGMALGADLAIAQAAMDLGIPLIAAVPFKGQSGRWPKESVALYDEALEYARTTGGVYLTYDDTYRGAWMLQGRNEWMVDLLKLAGPGSGLYALYDHSPSGGTFNCLKYLRKVGAPFLGNLWNAYVFSSPAMLKAVPSIPMHTTTPGTGVPAASTRAA